MTNYQQVIPYVDRMDYVAAMGNELAYVLAVETGKFRLKQDGMGWFELNL